MSRRFVAPGAWQTFHNHLLLPAVYLLRLSCVCRASCCKSLGRAPPVTNLPSALLGFCVQLKNRRRSEDIPAAHMEVMRKLLVGYSGICNFNYKIRPNGDMFIFEVNARIGADLACDIPRRRAAAFFNKLDTIGPSHLLGKVGRS